VTTSQILGGGGEASPLHPTFDRDSSESMCVELRHNSSDSGEGLCLYIWDCMYVHVPNI